MKNERGRFLSFRFRDWNFENKLILLVLFLALVPLIGYALFSLNKFRVNSIRYAETDLSHVVKSLVMLCEAQEALDRLKKGDLSRETDSITGASPAWREGDEFKSLRSIIKDIKVAETGYAHVFDSSGLILIHPSLENQNVFQLDPKTSEHFKRIRNRAINLPMGAVETFRYPWSDEVTGRTKMKIAKFGYFKPYDWIVVAGSYEDEILRPYSQGRRVFYYIIFGTTVVVILLGFGLARYMMRPIKQLTEASSSIANGDFHVELPIGSKDEIGRLAESFHVMTEKLQEARHDLLEWSKTLEQRVEERTEELKRAHDRMLTAEKMASLGKLSAMVAHEINNPLSGVLSYLKLSNRLLREDTVSREKIESIINYLDLSSTEVKRVGEIVRNLLMFAKRSFGEYSQVRLNQIIDKSVALIKHSLDVKEIQLIMELDEKGSDLIYCDPSGLQQMLIALMVNANEAMGDGGELRVKTDCRYESEIEFRIIDTGKGIPEETLNHIFEPFFTTKDSQKGTGLGLSVVYGIVQAHGGTINVISKIDQGTTFIVKLPRKPPIVSEDVAAPAGVFQEKVGEGERE